MPMLLLPEVVTTREAETYFDWEEVTDPSGVTYTLQIASDEDFTSIVLEKKDLTNSEYTLTEEEKLEPGDKKAIYYWRVKAIDGASNESGWTTPGSFLVGFAFAFDMPNWALYLLIGLGGLGLFFSGFWLGKRTAYDY